MMSTENVLCTDKCDVNGKNRMHTENCDGYGNMSFIRTKNVNGQTLMYSEKCDVYGKTRTHTGK